MGVSKAQISGVLPSALNIPAYVKTILAKYPAGDTHVYLPGAGVPVLGPEMWSSGTLVLTSQANWTPIYNNSVFFPNSFKIYQVSLTVTGMDNNERLNIYAQNGNPIPNNPTADGNYTFTTIPDGTTTNLAFTPSGAVSGFCTYTISNISIKEILSYDYYSTPKFNTRNYYNVTGTLPAVVDSVDPLIIDAAQELGPELVTNGDFSQGQTGWLAPTNGWAISEGTLVGTNVTQYATYGQDEFFVARATYQYSLSVTSITGGRVRLLFYGGTESGSASITTVGIYSGFITANTGNNVFTMQSLDVGVSCVIDNISIKKVPGVHAKQITALNMPKLRRGSVNLITYGKDFMQSSWQVGGTAVKTSSDTVTFNGTGNANYIRQNLSSVFKSSSTYTLSAKVSGSGGIGVWLSNGIDDFVQNTFTLSATPTVVSVTKSFNSTTPSGSDARFYSTGAASAVITDIQLEYGSTPTTYSPTWSVIGSNPSQGLYSWGFDGVNSYLTLSSPLFQMSDDHVNIAGAMMLEPLTSNRVISCPSGVVSTINRAGMISYDANLSSIQSSWFDGTNYDYLLYAYSRFIPFVASSQKRSSTLYQRVNGVERNSKTATASFTSTEGAIGAYPGMSVVPFPGRIFAVVVIKGTVSDADLLTLERWVGKLSGVVI